MPNELYGLQEPHGTHVCGIIGARPPNAASEGFVGIASGVELLTIRVDTRRDQTTGAPAGQGSALVRKSNLNEAIHTFCTEEPVDIINISLTLIEDPRAPVDEVLQESVRYAEARGALCVAAAGNRARSQSALPARLAEAVSVGALGKMGAGPKYEPNSCYPHDRRGAGDYYLSNTSNYGDVSCCAPGVRIISTMTAPVEGAAPYLDMSGTSMAAPMATAILAMHLARPEHAARYRACKGKERTAYARDLLIKICRDIGLPQEYQGAGMVHA